MESNLNTTDPVLDWLITETNCSPHAARQAAQYVAAQQAAVQVVPTQTTVVFERFFDDTGGMQLVVHAPFGARIAHAMEKRRLEFAFGLFLMFVAARFIWSLLG